MHRNLKFFLAIAETGNLTAAAGKIGLTQPSLTKRLNNLESELGCRLFLRHRRGMALTAAGTRFYRRARRIEQEFLQAREELRSLERAGLDVLRVGAGPLFHLRYVAPVFSVLRQEFPALRLDLIADTNARTIPMLTEGELDIVLGVISPTDPDSALQVRPMTVVEHGVIMPPGEDTRRGRRLRPERIRSMQWVLYSKNWDSEHWLVSYFARNGLGTPEIAASTSSFATGLDLVRQAGLVMMAPIQLESVVEAAGLQVVSADPPLTRLPAGAYVRQSSLGNPAIELFLEVLSNQLRMPGR